MTAIPDPTIFPHRKDIPVERVTHTDREKTKKVVYSVVYGAGGQQSGAESLGSPPATSWMSIPQRDHPLRPVCGLLLAAITVSQPAFSGEAMEAGLHR